MSKASNLKSEGRQTKADPFAKVKQRHLSVSQKKARKNGRPLLVEGERSMRAGFVLTNKQFDRLTALARLEGVTFSVMMRRAIDLLECQYKMKGKLDV